MLKKETKRKRIVVATDPSTLVGMTSITKRWVSVLVMGILIIQVVLPGQLFQWPVQRARAATSVTVNIPLGITDWDIGDTNLIVWETTGDAPSYFKLYYSENSGGDWTSIDSYEAYTGSPQNYSWVTPVVNGAGESDFEIKVEAYNVGDTLVASDASVDFKIDYGPATSATWAGDTESAVNLIFDSFFYLKDQYSNTILSSRSVTADVWWYNLEWKIWGDTNNDQVEDVGETWDHGPGWSFDSGTGLYSATDSFTQISYYAYKLHVDGNNFFTPNQPTTVIDIVAEGVYIDSPTSATSWIIGGVNDIVIRAGGTTMVDILDFDYSPNNGTDWYTIEHGVTGVPGWVIPVPYTYEDWTIPNATPGSQWKVRVKTYDSSEVLIATGTSAAFTVAYGSVASFTVEAPPTANVNKFFSLTVTAKDTNGYTITTFNQSTAIGSSPSTITPVTIGNGTTTGTWASGVVTYDSFAISGTGSQIITASYASASGNDTILIIGGGGYRPPNCPADIKKPISTVVGILDANNNIKPMPVVTFTSSMTVVMEAIDPDQGILEGECVLGSGVQSAELKLRKGTGAWESLGEGIYFMPASGKKAGYDYYKVTLDNIPDKTFATYYFYSIAKDWAENIELVPGGVGYDASTLIDMRRPYVTSTIPISSQTNIANNAPIIVSFSMPMNVASVWNAFSVNKQGSSVPVDLRWSAVWSNANQVVSFRHTTVFAYSGIYTVNIDSAIATNANGAPLDITTGAPIPFTFTVASAPIIAKPYLATSTKVVNLLIAPSGSLLTYTVVLRNTGTGTGNVTFSDAIPTNTTYANYVTNATYNATTNSVGWSGTMVRNATRTITFRVRINKPLANGIVITNQAVINDGNGNIYNPSANTVVNTVPSSNVIGNLNTQGALVQPMQVYTYLSPFTIVARGIDATYLSAVNLYYRTSAVGDTVYKNFGPGEKYLDNPDGSANYKWTINFPEGQNLVYYFYTRAVDTAGNIEAAPSRYDSYTRVNTLRPYMSITVPAHNALNVPISGTYSYVRFNFNTAMDRASVLQAFTISRPDGTQVPDFNWVATWNTASTQVILRHATVPFEYKTQYQIFLDPTITKDVNGKYLNNDDSRAKPNPFLFTTAVKTIPDISASVKLVDSPTIRPGALLLFTIKVDNAYGGTTAARVTVTDPLPANTTYANYMSGGLKYNATTKIFYWSGTILQGLSKTLQFQVRVNSPMDNNLNIINTVTLKDQTNPAIQKQAISIVGSSPNWVTSYINVELPASRTDGMARPGDTLTYTVFLENTGDMNVGNAIVTLPLPPHTTYTDLSSNASGLAQIPNTNSLAWTGTINVGQSQTFNYQLVLDNNNDLFKAPNDKVYNQITLVDGVNGYSLENTVMVYIPPTVIGGHKPPAGTAPYITEQVQPAVGLKSVKLYSPIVIPFSKEMAPDTLKYEVFMGNFLVDTSTWQAVWSPDSTQVTLIPDGSLESGETYTVHVLEAFDIQGLALITDGPIMDNRWQFTTVRPTLYFADPTGPISFVAGLISQQIILRLGDWLNFAEQDTIAPIYAPYAVEHTDITLNLNTTSSTGRMGVSNTSGNFFTKSWGPWYNNPTDTTQYLKIPVGTDTAKFYYTDNEIGNNSLSAADSNPGYTIIDPQGKPVITSETKEFADQIYFGSEPQQIPVNNYSNPIIFGVANPDGGVLLKTGRMFLLSSSSATGRFYTSTKNIIDEYVDFTTNQGKQTFYRHYIQGDTLTETIYYKDSTPGSYIITIADGATNFGVAGVSIQEALAKSAGQNIIILPLDITDCSDSDDCTPEELVEVNDNTGRKLVKIVVNPDDTTVLPNGTKLFKARGYDEDGNEIDELIFSWYIVAGGGKIVKMGAVKNNHDSLFTAGKTPGVYWGTVMAVAYYNGGILAGNATVRVARVIDSGRPGTLPSTGPNGIQIVFMILTLISAIALAAVEHYEKKLEQEEQEGSAS